MLARGQITVTNLDDGKTPFLHQTYKMKDGRFLKHYPVYEAPPVNGYKEGDLWHWSGEDYPGRNYFREDYNSYTLSTYGYIDINPMEENFIGTYYDKDVSLSSGQMYFGFTRIGSNGNSGADWLMANGFNAGGATGRKSSMRYFSFYPRVESGFNNMKTKFFIKLEKGSTATPYSPAPEDLTGGKTSGYFVANKSNTTFDFNDWTFYADELAYSDTDKFYPKFEGTYSDYNEVASDDQTKYTWKIIQADNVPSITTVSKEYYLSTSNTSTVGGTWSEKIPPWTTGKLYWSRMHTIFADGTIKTSTPVLDEGLNLSLVTTLEVKASTQTLSTTVSQQAGQIALKANTTDVNTLTGRVTSAEGSITTIAGQVALKANSSDVNTLTGRVSTAEGNITTQAGQIALKVNQSVVDTLTGRVSTTESKITATDGKVTTLTTKTDGNTTSIGLLETSYSGLNSTVTALETGKVGTVEFSALEQNLNGFKTTVANTYADKSTVTQLAGQWTTTTELANGHTSQISSLGTQINLRATKTEVAESILADKTIKDTRTTNQLPPWYFTNYPKQKAYEFKQCTTIGLPASAGTYASVVTEVPWTDASGGTIEQTATATDGVYQRRGTSVWSAWAKVADSSNVVSQINISPESILIASNKIQIKGDTYIDNGVIKTAHIADLAVSGAKIANASIASAKIISLDASKITANTLSAITTNTGTLNVNGWLTTTAENFGFRGTYDYGDNVSGAYNPRWFDGDYRLSHRYLTFQANTYDVTTSNTRGTFKHYTESFYGPDYLKLRHYPSSSNTTIRNRVDITADRIQITKDWSDASGIILNADGSSVFGARGQFNAGLDIGSPDNVGLRVGRIDAPLNFQTLILNDNRNLGTLTLSYDTSRYISSMDIYNRTYSLAANMYISPNGILGRATSARKYKSNITTLTSVYSKAKKVLNIRPVTWHDKRALEEVGKVQIGYGFIADEFHDAGLVEVVSYGSDGQVEGLAYDHISIYHNVILNDHEQQLKRLDSINSNVIKLVANDSIYGLRLNNLESEVFRLKKRIEELEKIA